MSRICWQPCCDFWKAMLMLVWLSNVKHINRKRNEQTKATLFILQLLKMLCLTRCILCLIKPSMDWLAMLKARDIVGKLQGCCIVYSCFMDRNLDYKMLLYISRKEHLSCDWSNHFLPWLGEHEECQFSLEKMEGSCSDCLVHNIKERKPMLECRSSILIQPSW